MTRANTWFATPEVARLAGCLSRLLPHLRRDAVAITGSVAMEIGLARAGHPGLRRTITDLDCVATDLDAVFPGVASAFLISHYHVPQPDAPKFMVQLVDPVARIRIDIFPDLAGSIEQAQTVTIGDHLVKVLTLESIFDHKARTLAKASKVRPVDPKHQQDAQVLQDIVSGDVPAVAPDALLREVYGGAADLTCRRCEISRHERFPLASRQEIFDILDWQ
jgi:hypothetical protein